MYHLEECASRSKNGRTAVPCPFCKQWVFGPKSNTDEGEARLEWHCIQCHASFSSLPPFEEPGEDKESFKEKIINLLLEEGSCEMVVKIFATSSKRPPIFIEENLRELLSNL